MGRFSIGVPAENGRKALDAARKAALYVVVTDVDMPVMDGVDLRRHLRAGTATRDVIVIVVTGDASESGRAALETGCDAVLREALLWGSAAGDDSAAARHTPIGQCPRRVAI